jgi:hypothetical protein
MHADKPTDGPETMSQARTWQIHNNRYVDLGLCYPCAAQAAYGHQLGFSRIHPPCEVCAPIVAGFEFPAVAPWRKTLQARHAIRARADAKRAAESVRVAS